MKKNRPTVVNHSQDMHEAFTRYDETGPVVKKTKKITVEAEETPTTNSVVQTCRV